MFGPPPEQPGKCNAIISIGDDHGDNSATFVCCLPMGHGGPHREINQRCEMTWEQDERAICARCGELFRGWNACRNHHTCVHKDVEKRLFEMGEEYGLCRKCLPSHKEYCPECKKLPKCRHGKIKSECYQCEQIAKSPQLLLWPDL